MALEIKATSRWWYARFMVNGKLRRFPLMEKRAGRVDRIEIKGIRPVSMKHPEKGDAAFLESYHRARAAHDRLLEEELSKKHVEDLTQRLIEAKTGTRLDFVKVEAVPEAWAKIPRKREPCPKYFEASKAKLRAFADFMRRHHREAEDLAAVRAEHVRAFLDAESGRSLAPRSWNERLKLLKSVFAKLEPNADAYRAFLKNAAFRDEDTIHREPFKDDEIEAILKEAEADQGLCGPIATAVCTAMRKGDCAMLRWSSVDLEAGFIEVSTRKTGETVEIPILPSLREVLNRTSKTASEYVFIEAANLYQNDPHALDRRFAAILARAGFVGSETAERLKKEKPKPGPALLDLPVDELRRRGREAIEEGKMRATKRERMIAIFESYLDGKSLPAISRDLRVSKSTVSLHLNKIEGLAGAAVLRRRSPSPAPSVMRGLIRAEKTEGRRLHRGSIRGWHSFRVAFVTRALAGGMPEELVRRVTGHSAVDVVRKHYFRPGREEFRREFEKAAPRLLMNGELSRDEQLAEIIRRMDPKKLRLQALELLKKNTT